MKITIIILTIIHSLIHILGFIKSIYPGKFTSITMPISEKTGVIWLTSSLLFITTVILFLSHTSYWFYFGIGSIMLSQFVIIKSWKDALAGTFANILLIIVIFLKIKGII